MAKETKTQREIVDRVMHEFKEGDLERGHGGKVANPKQAIAIALSEAGASNEQAVAGGESEAPCADKAKERSGGQESQDKGGESRAQLYAEAKRKGVEGRSHMSKAELEKAVRG